MSVLKPEEPLMSKHVPAILLATLFLAGCATSRNYTPEVDSLNAKVDSLQSQLQEKNRENGALSDQVRALQGQLEAAQKDQRECERNLDDCLGKLTKRAPGTSSSVTDYAK